MGTILPKPKGWRFDSPKNLYAAPQKLHLLLSASSSKSPPLVLVMGALDPTGSDGLTADAITCATLGCHAITAATAITVRDTANLEDVHPLSPELLDDQARCLLEDMPVQAIKVGGVYSTEVASAIAQVAADYSQVPMVLHLGAQTLPAGTPADFDDAEDLLAATFELLLPQAHVVVVEYAQLSRWIADGHLQIEGLASPMHAFVAAGASWVLTLSAPLRPGHTAHMLIGNAGATAQWPCRAAADRNSPTDRSGPIGAAVSIALTALLARGEAVPDAVEQALAHGESAAETAFAAGMGRRIPNRTTRP